MKKQIFQVIRTVRKKRSNWTSEQDKLLIQASNSTKNKKWLFASKLIKEKTPFQCHQRFKLLNPNLKKGKWTEDEDAKLISLVEIFGKSWNLISKVFKTRSNKQIMNRYEEYLNDAVELRDFGEAEDQTIIQCYAQFGKNWNLYRDVLQNRSSRKIKKRFFLLLRAKRICLRANAGNGSVFSGSRFSLTNIEEISNVTATPSESELYQNQTFLSVSPKSEFFCL